MLGGIFSGLNLFGNAPKIVPVEEQAKEWQKTLTKAARDTERRIKEIERSIEKQKQECKKLVKSGNADSAKVLVRAIVKTKREVSRMHTGKAQMNSVCSSLKNTMAMHKVTGLISKSTDVMKSMNDVLSVPELRGICADMSREMVKAGLMDEMVGDAMASMEPADLDEQADAEVDKLMAEILGVTLTPETVARNAPVVSTAKAAPAEEEAAAADPMTDSEMAAIQSRLEGL